MKLELEEETYKIIGTCMKVHKTLGPGFLESVYDEALSKEFAEQSIPFKKQQQIRVEYNNQFLHKTFRADFICFDKIIIEIKAATFTHQQFSNQVVNYLKATGYPVGLLINFGEKSLKFKRFVNTPDYKKDTTQSV
jgi:GxxExxY protein